MRTLIILATLLGVSAQAQDWDGLRHLVPEQRISVRTPDGSWVEGRFRSWSPEALQVTVKKDIRRITLADADRVIASGKGSRWKSALIGAAVGFGLAFPVGAASAGYITDQNNPRFQTRVGVGAGLGLFGAGIGSAIGALAGGTKHTTVYRRARR